MIDYPNVPPLLGMALSADKSLMGPLSSTLGTEDLWDIVEVLQVDAHNRRAVERYNAQKAKG